VIGGGISGLVCAYRLQQLGIPAIICGPGYIDQAHKPDEFVEVTQMSLCEAYLKRLAAACC